MQPLTGCHLSLPTYASASQSRLQALYSDILPQKTSNPAAFHANIEWWRKTLEGVVAGGLQTNTTDRLVLNASRPLIDSLRVQGVGKPIGLGTAVTELLQPTPNASPPLPALIPRSAFFSLNQSIYASSSMLSALPSLIASYLIAKPLWWALEQMGIIGQDGIFSKGEERKWEGEYVVLSLVERAAEQVVSLQKSSASGPADALYSHETFCLQFSTCVGLGSSEEMSRSDAEVMLRYLERDKGCLVTDKECIKFVTSKDSSQVTAVDKGILELKLAVAKMQAQVEQLQVKVESLTQRASDAVKQKRNPLALSCIKSRKQVQNLLTKRLSALDNLESTLITVETAAGDVELMETYAQSTATLKTILSHPSLQQVSIDETMNALHDANVDARDVDNAIRDGLNIAGDITFDESEIEQEMKGLLQEHKAEEEAAALAKQLATQTPQEVPVGKEEHREQDKVAIPM